MDINKIKEALINSLKLLSKEVDTEIIQDTKAEYRKVIAQIENALKEFE